MLEPGRIAKLTQSAKVRPRGLPVVADRRNRHEPVDGEVRKPGDHVEKSFDLGRANSRLLRLLADVDLDQRVDVCAGRASSPVQLPGELQTVDGMDPVEQTDCIL